MMSQKSLTQPKLCHTSGDRQPRAGMQANQRDQCGLKVPFPVNGGGHSPSRKQLPPATAAQVIPTRSMVVVEIKKKIVTPADLAEALWNGRPRRRRAGTHNGGSGRGVQPPTENRRVAERGEDTQAQAIGSREAPMHRHHRRAKRPRSATWPSSGPNSVAASTQHWCGPP